jgi:hypothetical protein
MKITTKAINSGNTRSVFSGQFINNFKDPVYNPKVRTSRKGLAKSKIERRIIDEGIARAENANNRGFKKKIYSGTKPLFWDKSDFSPLKAGDFTNLSGYYRGGDAYQSNKNYKPEFGMAGTGTINADKPSGEVLFAPIKVRKSVKKDN